MEDLSPDKDKTILRSIISQGEDCTDCTTPGDGATVDVKLVGKFGEKVFEERELKFNIGDGIESGVVKGLEIALKRFKKGEKSRIVLNHTVAFGSNGNKDFNIPPDSSIAYEVTLINLEKAIILNYQGRITSIDLLNEAQKSTFLARKAKILPIDRKCQQLYFPDDELKTASTSSMIEYMLYNVIPALKEADKENIITRPVKINKKYFSEIFYPIDLHTVEERIVNFYYITSSECILDMQQIFFNLYLINEDDADLVKQAKSMETLFMKIMKKCPVEQSIEMKQKGDDRFGRTLIAARKLADVKEKRFILETLMKPHYLPLSFCKELIKSLFSKKKYRTLIQPFMAKVNTELFGCPDYSVIDCPMDLTHIEDRLDESIYEDSYYFFHDVNLIFQNAFTYNKRSSEVYRLAKGLKDIIQEEVKRFLSGVQREMPELENSEDESDVEIDV